MTFFREEHTYSTSRLNAVFSDSYFRRLLELDILKRISDYEYKFNFVGILSFQSILIFVYPKFFKTLPDEETLHRIIKVLKSCQKSILSTYDIEWIDTDLNANFPSELSICETVLADFMNYGLLKRNQKIESVEVSGDINWNRTVNEFTPFFSKGSPIYFQTVETNYTDISSSLIIKLHKWAIQYALKKYGKWLDLEEIVFEESSNNLADIGEKDYLITVIDQQLNQSFLQQELKTLNLIKQLISLAYLPSENPKFIYGTTSFHGLWEYVCAVVFSNRYYQFKNQIPAPIWTDNTNKTFKGSMLRPDLVIWDKKHSVFAILDAKYYNLKFGDGEKLAGNPGLEDISKQFLYLKAFEGFIGKQKIDTVINALIFPTDDTKNVIKYLGKIEFALFQNKAIYVFSISEQYLMRHFLANNKIEISQLVLLLKPFKLTI